MNDKMILSTKHYDLFSLVYDRYYQAIFAYFLSRTRTRETAEDLLQQTFTKVWAQSASLAAVPEERRGSWIFTVAKNTLTDHYRVQGSKKRVETQLLEASESDVAPAAEDKAVLQEEIRSLDRCIQELPEDLRTVLMMNVIGGLSSGEISEMTGIPSGTVRYRVHKARERLKERMSKEEYCHDN